VQHYNTEQPLIIFIVWGRTGASTHPASAIDILHKITPTKAWTPVRLANLVTETIRERRRKDEDKEVEEKTVNETTTETVPVSPLVRRSSGLENLETSPTTNISKVRKANSRATLDLSPHNETTGDIFN
jgi:hypothetical protein